MKTHGNLSIGLMALMVLVGCNSGGDGDDDGSSGGDSSFTYTGVTLAATERYCC